MLLYRPWEGGREGKGEGGERKGGKVGGRKGSGREVENE